MNLKLLCGIYTPRLSRIGKNFPSGLTCSRTAIAKHGNGHFILIHPAGEILDKLPGDPAGAGATGDRPFIGLMMEVIGWHG